MCDSVADYYGGIIGCSVKRQPPCGPAFKLPRLAGEPRLYHQAVIQAFGATSENLFIYLFFFPPPGETTPIYLCFCAARSHAADPLTHGTAKAPLSLFFQLKVIAAIVAQLFTADDIWRPEPSFFSRAAGLLLAAVVNGEFTFGKTCGLIRLY